MQDDSKTCPDCGAPRRDDWPPYLHHQDCPQAGQEQFDRWIAERQERYAVDRHTRPHTHHYPGSLDLRHSHTYPHSLQADLSIVTWHEDES